MILDQETKQFQKACSVLGINREDTQEDVRIKYRRIVSRIHPDAAAEKNCQADNAGNAVISADIAEVNAAYEFLIKKGGFEKYGDPRKASEPGPKKGNWKAPVNPGAYTERNIYQAAEDNEGNCIGTFTAARGRYYWDYEAEGFKLFMKSILAAVNDLIETQEEIKGSSYSELEKFYLQKELVYLLAGQFTDVENGLEAFSKEIVRDKNGEAVYYIPANLELQAGKRKWITGETLYPVQMKEHRLYLGRKDRQALGYLSFPDDRLYYVLIPMFENREVQVRIEVEDEVPVRSRSGNSLKLKLWVRRIQNETAVAESVNAKIRRLLENT